LTFLRVYIEFSIRKFNLIFTSSLIEIPKTPSKLVPDLIDQS
jgi:hypothetical protein